jgi:tRNA(fMet)-specific endonuclease VapC
MKYLLDTCTVSDFVKGHPATLQRIKSTSPKLIAVSTITRMEISFGLALNPDLATRLQPMLDDFFSAITTIPFDTAEAQASGVLRAALQKAGLPIGYYDTLIAGTGLVHGLIVVTANTREFVRVSGLQIEDWRVVQ